jgi:predicted outer membrane repeat protein
VYIISVFRTSSFTMSDNAMVSNNAADSEGGGVYIDGGHTNSSFTMSGSAVVFGNTASKDGGGVNAKGSFTMSDSATVSNNAADSEGGGVYVSGSFTMSGSAAVSGNTADQGGGVYVGNSFIMSGSVTVSGNVAWEKGGGVWVNEKSGSFTKTGGIIYGAKDGENSNTVIINGVAQTGMAAAIYGNDIHLRETTVTATQNLTKKGYDYTGQWSD